MNPVGGPRISQNPINNPKMVTPKVKPQVPILTGRELPINK